MSRMDEAAANAKRDGSDGCRSRRTSMGGRPLTGAGADGVPAAPPSLAAGDSSRTFCAGGIRVNSAAMAIIPVPIVPVPGRDPTVGRAHTADFDTRPAPTITVRAN